MAADKLVDSSQLDGALTATADAIRAINNEDSTTKKEWDMETGFADAVNAMTTPATATAGDILASKTAYAKGEKITGTIPTKTSANMTVSEKTVTAPAGYYASAQSKSVAEGEVTSGSANITSASFTYDSANANFKITGSASIGAPSVNTEGYISSTIGKRNGNTAQLNATAPKVEVQATSSSTFTKQPVIKRQTFTINGVTDASNGAETTTAPSSGVYVKVKSAANTATATINPSVKTAGYGTTSYYTASPYKPTVGANESADTYIPIATTSASVDGKTVSYGTGWIAGGSKSVADVVGTIGGTPANGSASAVITNTNSMATITDLTGKRAGTDYWQVNATATTTNGGYTPQYTVNTPGWIASTVPGTKQTVSVTADSTGQSIYIPKASLSASGSATGSTTNVVPGALSVVNNETAISGKTRLGCSPTSTASDVSTPYYIAVQPKVAAGTNEASITLSGTASASTSSAGYAPGNLTGSGTVSGTAKAKAKAADGAAWYIPVQSAEAEGNSADVTNITTDGSNAGVNISGVIGDKATTEPTSGYYVAFTGTGSSKITTAGWVPTGALASKTSDVKYFPVTAATITQNKPTINSGTGLVTATTKTTAGYTPAATTAASNTLQLTTKAATTFNVSTSEQSIAAGTYLTGKQTFRAITTSGIDAANIKKGTVIQVGDSGSATRIKNVTGTYSTVSSDKTALTAAALRSGYAGFANGGDQINGTMADVSVSQGTTTISSGNITRGTATWGTGYITSGSIGAATFTNTGTEEVEYVDISSSAPALISNDYLYINKGYVDNLKISLAKLVPDEADVGIDTSSDSILLNYTAYNNDGKSVAGTIPTLQSSDFNFSGASITIPLHKYTGASGATAIKKTMGNATYGSSASISTQGVVTPKVTLDETATTTYGFTTTKPSSGTSGTNYLTIDPNADITTNGKVTPKATVSVAGYAAKNTTGTNGTAITVNPTINNGTNYYIPVIAPTFSGGSFSTETNTNTVGTAPKVTVASSGTFKSATTYGVTTTKPSGTDGTNYLTITGSATPTNGKATSTVKVNCSDITYTNSAGVIAEHSGTVAKSPGSTGDITKDVTITPSVSGSFGTMYIPIKTVSFSGGTLTKTAFSKEDLEVLLNDGSDKNITESVYTVGAKDESNYPYYIKVSGSTPAVTGNTNVKVTKRTYTVGAGAIKAVSGGEARAAIDENIGVSVNAASGNTYVGLKKAAIKGTSTNATATTTVDPGDVTVTKQNTPSGVTNAASGNATTSAPSSGVYVAVLGSAAANSTGATSSISGSGSATVTAEGYAPSNLTGNVSVTGTATAKTNKKDSLPTYIPITTATPTFNSPTPSGGSTASGTNITLSSTNNGIKIQTAYTVNAASVTYKAAVAGWVSKAANAEAVKTTARTSTNGTAYYATAVTVPTTKTFSVTTAENTEADTGALIVTNKAYRVTNVTNQAAGTTNVTNSGNATVTSGSATAGTLTVSAYNSSGTAENNKAIVNNGKWVATSVSASGTYYGRVTIGAASLSYNSPTPSGGSTATGTNVTLSTTDNGMKVQTAYTVNAANVTYKAATSGYVSVAKDAVAVATTARSSTNGTAYYVTGVTMPKDKGFTVTTTADTALDTTSDLDVTNNAYRRVDITNKPHGTILVDNGTNATIPWVAGKYIATNVAVGSAVAVGTTTSSSSWKHCILNCVSGQKFSINGHGGDTPRLWCFIDSANKVTAVAAKQATLTYGEIVAPANSVKLIVNTDSGDNAVVIYKLGATTVTNVGQATVNSKSLGSGDLSVGAYEGTSSTALTTKQVMKSGLWVNTNVSAAGTFYGRVVVAAGTITNNTSGGTSTGTINRGKQIKIAKGYYAADAYYTAQANSGTLTISASGDTNCDGYAKVNVAAGSITNNTSGGTSTATINRGSQIKIGKGYYASDLYYTAQSNSGTLTIDTSKNAQTNISVDGKANINITGITVPKDKTFALVSTADSALDTTSDITITNDAYRQVKVTNKANGNTLVTNTGVAKVVSASATTGTLTVSAYNSSGTAENDKSIVTNGKWVATTVSAAGTFYGRVTVSAGTFTNNTSGGTSAGTINRGKQLKIGKGYYAADTFYTAQANSGTLTISASGNSISCDGYAAVKVPAATPKFDGGALSGTATATASNATISDSTNSSGISITTACTATRAAVLYNGAVAGWVAVADNATALASGTGAMTGKTYYINGVTLTAGKSFTIAFPAASGVPTFKFTVDSSNNVTVTEV